MYQWHNEFFFCGSKYQYIFLTHECSDLQTDPCSAWSGDKRSMPLSLVIFSVSASPSLSQNGCISILLVMSRQLRRGVQADTPGSGTEGTGKMGDLGANRVCLYAVSEGVALSVTARLRPQDKNVFDIVCNWVMFALLVSGGSVSANRHLIVSYGEVKRSLWNSGRRGVSLDMESKGRF